MLNPDIFRKEFTPISDEAKAEVLAVKNAAESLWTLIENSHIKRASLPEYENTFYMAGQAANRLEECVMWAVKYITSPIIPEIDK